MDCGMMMLPLISLPRREEVKEVLVQDTQNWAHHSLHVRRLYLSTSGITHIPNIPLILESFHPLALEQLHVKQNPPTLSLLAVLPSIVRQAQNLHTLSVTAKSGEMLNHVNADGGTLRPTIESLKTCQCKHLTLLLAGGLEENDWVALGELLSHRSLLSQTVALSVSPGVGIRYLASPGTQGTLLELNFVDGNIGRSQADVDYGLVGHVASPQEKTEAARVLSFHHQTLQKLTITGWTDYAEEIKGFLSEMASLKVLTIKTPRMNSPLATPLSIHGHKMNITFLGMTAFQMLRSDPIFLESIFRLPNLQTLFIIYESYILESDFFLTRTSYIERLCKDVIPCALTIASLSEIVIDTFTGEGLRELLSNPALRVTNMAKPCRPMVYQEGWSGGRVCRLQLTNGPVLKTVECRILKFICVKEKGTTANTLTNK